MKKDRSRHITRKKDAIVVSLNPRLYSLEAIYGASYVFIDRAYIFLDGDARKEIKVSIRGKNGLSEKGLRGLAGEFNNELLNYALREKINRANRRIRERIIEKALAVPQQGVSVPEADYGDYLKDPLGIAIPWEEKHGRRKVK